MSEKERRKIELPSTITVRELAQKIESSPIQVIKTLMSNGVLANINQVIDFDTAAIVSSELGFEAILEQIQLTEDKKDENEIPLWRRLIADEDTKKLVPRPPVVTILGHVDHGKTTLLDAIRHTHVATGEAGGITQHIKAYQVKHKDKLITFLDTPGHEAFTAMRARGAQGADIVVLVVAANDGVMPQTKEAISHAKAAHTPIIVALNKVDRPDANLDYTKRQLAELGLVPDEWDGNTLVVPVSAKQKKGIDDLLEAIVLVAENKELEIQANPNGKVMGTVIEAERDRAKGVIASLLVQNGTLKVTDTIVAGTTYGKLKAMFDHLGRRISKAPPSTPIGVMGLNDVPRAGDIFQVVPSEKDARIIIENLKLRSQLGGEEKKKTNLEEIFARFEAGEVKELALLIKADVQGSLEPIISSINTLEKGAISVNIIHAETGNISESDVMLASASKAVVIGFNVKPDQSAARLAEIDGVSIRTYDVIYRLIEDIEKALKGMLAPDFKETILGRAEVLQVFKITKLGNIAGCKVISGDIKRNGNIRVKRNNEVIFSGEIGSLKHEKDDVREVRQGFECGIAIKNFNDFLPRDILECYIIEKFGG